jgi:putative protease
VKIPVTSECSVNRGLKLIAGTDLYAFNRWSADWLFRQGVACPNHAASRIPVRIWNRRSIPAFRNRVMITIFAYPASVSHAFQAAADYNFTFFQRSSGCTFKALSTETVPSSCPRCRFSITDKVASIRKTDSRVFLIDLSRTKVVKGEYRLLMESYRKGSTLPEVSRFNWKDGFYDPEKMKSSSR